ncbi:YeeE/YedE thiosulfate transporter family protein [Cohaesibacter celericrescens]|uniref:Uncharacterized protein n=1 Tax=Cohaesibacter celericrescens TaxID=2067669 RepID=A0A2N5XQA3_9HYPH|nr:YeeE/YedE thiosulfate transporter family protein [Cohaesibacter celericrescens]PLW76673.1 hypothetical protein C0081_11400 [Cohaesibacter celericrescens]
MILNWKLGGLLLGGVFFLAVLLVKPIGVSTQFVILDGMLWDAVSSDIVTVDETAKSGFSSPNAYLNKSGGKYAESVANPLNYSFVFVLAMLGGAAISGYLRGGVTKEESQMPEVWREKFGSSTTKRYFWSFVGGFIVLYGARMAGGCTSGHMMSGMMQTAVSGYIFTLGAFAAAFPLALALYKKKG